MERNIVAHNRFLTNSTAWRAIPIVQYPLYNDNMEQGTNGWVTSGTPAILWHQETASCEPNFRSPSTAWYYGSASTCDYGTSNSGLLTSPQISADYYSNLYYWFRKEYEQCCDHGILQISENGGSMVDEEEVFNNEDAWRHHTADISSHSGKNIKLGFYSSANASTSYTGWMIDDVEVWGCNVHGTNPIQALAYAKPTPVCETSSYLLDGTGTYAIGCSNLLYQWYENGLPISGATSLTYTVPANHAPGTFACTLVATCSENPSQTDTSNPADVQVVPMPPEVPNSLLLNKINAGTQIHFVWSNVTGGDSYIAYSDTVPSGTFVTQVGSSISGTIGLDVSMPPQNSVFYLVAAQNAVCGPGPK